MCGQDQCRDPPGAAARGWSSTAETVRGQTLRTCCRQSPWRWLVNPLGEGRSDGISRTSWSAPRRRREAGNRVPRAHKLKESLVLLFFSLSGQDVSAAGEKTQGFLPMSLWVWNPPCEAEPCSSKPTSANAVGRSISG